MLGEYNRSCTRTDLRTIWGNICRGVVRSASKMSSGDEAGDAGGVVIHELIYYYKPCVHYVKGKKGHMPTMVSLMTLTRYSNENNHNK
jgi:hypothetical protein